MVDADDVGAGAGDDLQQLYQTAGLVGDLGGELHDASSLAQTLGDDADQGGHIHIAAGNHAYGLLIIHQSQNGGSNLVVLLFDLATMSATKPRFR